MTAHSQGPTPKSRDYKKGQRLYCQNCGAEIEIINPCSQTPAAQVMRCCGRDMTPEVGVTVNMDD